MIESFPGTKHQQSISKHSRISDALPFISLFVLALALYLRTLAPGLLDGDSAEFQMALWNYSLVHPTGYPLYILIGGVFAHVVPFGDPAYRVNLLSALFASIAVALLGMSLLKITKDRVGALVGAAFLATAGRFWLQATEAEVYAFNSLFVGLLILLSLNWVESRSRRVLVGWGVVFTLALLHHRSIALLLPAFLVLFILVLGQSRRLGAEPRWFPLPLRQSLIIAPLLGIILVSYYLVIPLRVSQTPYSELYVSPSRTITTFSSSPSGIWREITGERFEAELGWRPESINRLGSLLPGLVDQFGLAGAILGLIGVIRLFWRRETRLLYFVLLGIGTVAVFNAIYFIRDIDDFYTPIYIMFALVIGLGATFLRGFISGILNPDSSRGMSSDTILEALIPLFLLATPIVNMAQGFTGNDRSAQYSTRASWNAILEKALGPNPILVSNDRDEIVPMWYLQYVENRAKGWLGLFPLITPAPEHSDIVQLLESVLDSGRPVYLIKEMPGLEIRFPIDSHSPLPRVTASEYPPPTISSNLLLGDSIKVAGVTLIKDPRQVGIIQIAVYWQPLHSLASDYTGFVHVTDDRGHKVAQGNDHKVGGEFYPTSKWRVGGTLHDVYEVTLPSDLQAGSYNLLVGMYSQPSFEPIGEPVEVKSIDLGR